MKKDNRKSCNQCDSVLKDGRTVHRISYTDWDAENQGFQKEPIEENYCRDCWSNIRPSNNGTEYEIESAEKLWRILSASSGQLVADFSSVILGSHNIVRIKNNVCQRAYSKRQVVGDNIIGIRYEYEIKNRDWFDRFISDIVDNDLPSYIKLINVEETAFDNFKDIKSDQESIDNFA